MIGRLGRSIPVFIFSLFFCTCNNFFHDLIPPDENRIIRFEIDGQIGTARIGPNTVDVTVGKGTELNAVIPRISVSRKASLIPMTMDYVQAAFPGIDFMQAAIQLYSTTDIVGYVYDLIRETPGFNVPALTLPVDFTGPVTFLVISGQGSIRQYTVNVEIDSGEPKLSGFSFAKYDNPELVTDALGKINETNLTVIAAAVYPVEMDLSYALIPSFSIMGERLEIDGVEAASGETEIQFEKMLGEQTITVTVWRDGESKEYTLTVTFIEDPDTVRSITDFRFYKTDNSRIAANAVASIVDTGNTGTITVQVYYSGAKPSTLIPGFITPGTVSVGGVQQTSRVNVQDFSAPLEYGVVSRNGQYSRLYTVKVEFINLVSAAPRITSFRFNQNINHELVQDTVGEISDGLIMIDAYYGGNYPPDTLKPEFTAQGIVTVTGSVQISGASPQSFNRQVKYTVTNPENSVLTRDYWVQTRMTRDVSSDAKIIAFDFYPEDYNEITDPIIGKIDQGTGKITLFAPVGSGVTTRPMYPRFEAVGQVSVGGVVQSSGGTPQTFNVPIIYTVTSANGKNSRNYEVTVRELRSTIFVNWNAWGENDGTNWENAFKSLSDAIKAAAQFPEDVPKEIWIAAGTYKPGSAVEDYFRLIPNTSYIGGFAGNETAKSQRNLTANKVTISGDLGGGLYSSNLFALFDDNNYYLPVDGDLVLEDLTLADAKVSLYGDRGKGAAINAVLSDRAELNISRCNFNGFTVVGGGGVVYVSGGSAVIVDTIIEDLQKVSGGSVYSSSGAVYVSECSLTVNNLTLRNITSDDGLYSSRGTLTVDGLTLRNIADRGIYKYSGGGVSLSGIDADEIKGDAVSCTSISNGLMSIRDSKFNNTGSVSISSSVSVLITDTEISNNSGNSALYVNSGNATTTIERVTIDGVSKGRGIWAFSTNLVLISGSQIRNCTTTDSGGGIWLEGTGNKEISNTTIDNVQAIDGGAVIAVFANTLMISNMSITDARASNASYTGGIACYEFGSLIVDGLVLRNITGKGINIDNNSRHDGNISLSRIDATNISNFALGVALWNNDMNESTEYLLSIRNSKFNNTGKISIHIEVKTSILVSDTEIYNSTSDDNALSVSSQNSPIKIDNITIDGVPNGRGIWAFSWEPVWINGSQIRNCTTTESGGGIFLRGTGNNEISGVTIEDCTASENGGGIYAFASGPANLSISNTIIKNAVAGQNGGGLYKYNFGKLVVTDSSFDNCRAADECGAIYVSYVGNEITGTDFINCTSLNANKIFNTVAFKFIRDSTFTHNNNLANLGTPSTTYVVSVFGGPRGEFENCTFTNLKCNYAGENYLFCGYTTYPDIDDGNDGYPFSQYGGELTLRDCTFNFNDGSAGLMALVSSLDTLLMDNCKINNNGSRQPLIWLNGNNPPVNFRFRLNINSYNSYNGTPLNNVEAITKLYTDDIMRLTNNATPVVVP
jgi:parallel beta-helix repeat protein